MTLPTGALFIEGVHVDVLGHSAQRLTNQKIVEKEMYS
jgi:hypothetical protein